MNIKRLTFSALMIALIFISTVVIAIPSPLGGYINLGDAAIYIASYFLKLPSLSFMVGGIGSALGDLYLGYVIYAIPTLIIKGTMGAVASYMLKQNKLTLGLFLGYFIMVIGYYIAEIFILGHLLSPLANVPYNLIQGLIGSIVGIVLIHALRKIKIDI